MKIIKIQRKKKNLHKMDNWNTSPKSCKETGKRLSFSLRAGLTVKSVLEVEKGI